MFYSCLKPYMYPVCRSVLIIFKDMFSFGDISDIWLLRYKQDSFGCFLIKCKLLIFSKFFYISVTKYRSEVVLYSKLSARYYPLSPQIKTIAVAFLQAK